jgi:peptidoglycan hydrolase-like protein with peptidoglycan-binding domain
MRRLAVLACVFAAALGHAAAAAAEGGPGPIAALQSRLSQLGYDPGPRDGVMSAKTQRAMLAYRRATGRPIATGTAGDPIAAAQTALQRLGFLSAPADGVIGPQTRDAIIRFQAANHLPVDPRVSDPLLAELDQAAAPAATPAQAPVPSSEPATPPAAPEISGREPLPAGMTPPPIR